jgi:hypothetical protein
MKEKKDDGEIRFEHCPTEQMWADINTKPKQGAVFREFRGHVMGVPAGYNDDEYKKLIQNMRNMIDICYEDINKPVIIDKSRGWIGPNIMRSVSRVIDGQFKMIVTVRFLPDCVAELVNFAKPNNLDEFIELDESIENLKSTYISLEEVYKHKPDNFLIVEYEDLIKNPKTQLNRIHKFLELPPFEYDFNNIDGSKVLKDDENLFNTDEFHDIKPVLAKQKDVNSKDVLKHNYIPFCQPEFWLDQPRTIIEPHDIDLQLEAAIKGDFAEAWRLAEKLEKEEPNKWYCLVGIFENYNKIKYNKKFWKIYFDKNYIYYKPPTKISINDDKTELYKNYMNKFVSKDELNNFKQENKSNDTVDNLFNYYVKKNGV